MKERYLLRKEELSKLVNEMRDLMIKYDCTQLEAFGICKILELNFEKMFCQTNEVLGK